MRKWLDFSGVRSVVVAVLGSCVVLLACSKDREDGGPPAPTYEADVAPIFESRCLPCHAGSSPAAGWSATTYLSAIACVAPLGAVATLPRDARAPVIAALDTATHQGMIKPSERAVIGRWVAGGSPAFMGTVHSPSIIDPRSDAFHGKSLRAKRWAPVLDPNDAEVCGRCHMGTPARPPGVASPAPGATACTACHTEPQGVLACPTCHGSGTRAYPPRDSCFFPGDRMIAGAHAAHMQPSVADARGLACATCHPTPGPSVIGGLHGNGSVEVIFEPTLAEASYDRAKGICAVACHDRGGGRSRPAWSETAPMDCNSCHRSPPEGHFPGACTNCHKEANAAGTALSGGPLHMNGRVDLGDGSGKCGACHGSGDDPWPNTNAHAAHKSPTLTVPIDCSNCHVVPPAVMAPGHLDGAVQIAFGGRALDRGASPTWSASGCSEVACHGAKLVDPPPVVPEWKDATGAATKCGACHGIPPTQHTPSTSCDRATCHGSEVARDAAGVPSILSSGKTLHINGVIDHGL